YIERSHDYALTLSRIEDIENALDNDPRNLFGGYLYSDRAETYENELKLLRTQAADMKKDLINLKKDLALECTGNRDTKVVIPGLDIGIIESSPNGVLNNIPQLQYVQEINSLSQKLTALGIKDAENRLAPTEQERRLSLRLAEMPAFMREGISISAAVPKPGSMYLGMDRDSSEEKEEGGEGEDSQRQRRELSESRQEIQRAIANRSSVPEQYLQQYDQYISSLQQTVNQLQSQVSGISSVGGSESEGIFGSIPIWANIPLWRASDKYAQEMERIKLEQELLRTQQFREKAWEEMTLLISNYNFYLEYMRNAIKEYYAANSRYEYMQLQNKNSPSTYSARELINAGDETVAALRKIYNAVALFEGARDELDIRIRHYTRRNEGGEKTLYGLLPKQQAKIARSGVLPKLYVERLKRLQDLADSVNSIEDMLARLVDERRTVGDGRLWQQASDNMSKTLRRFLATAVTMDNRVINIKGQDTGRLYYATEIIEEQDDSGEIKGLSIGVRYENEASLRQALKDIEHELLKDGSGKEYGVRFKGADGKMRTVLYHFVAVKVDNSNKILRVYNTMEELYADTPDIGQETLVAEVPCPSLEEFSRVRSWIRSNSLKQHGIVGLSAEFYMSGDAKELWRNARYWQVARNAREFIVGRYMAYSDFEKAKQEYDKWAKLPAREKENTTNPFEAVNSIIFGTAVSARSLDFQMPPMNKQLAILLEKALLDGALLIPGAENIPNRPLSDFTSLIAGKIEIQDVLGNLADEIKKESDPHRRQMLIERFRMIASSSSWHGDEDTYRSLVYGIQGARTYEQRIIEAYIKRLRLSKEKFTELFEKQFGKASAVNATAEQLQEFFKAQTGLRMTSILGERLDPATGRMFYNRDIRGRTWLLITDEKYGRPSRIEVYDINGDLEVSYTGGIKGAVGPKGKITSDNIEINQVDGTVSVKSDYRTDIISRRPISREINETRTYYTRGAEAILLRYGTGKGRDLWKRYYRRTYNHT
ncbi:MAG: hypothetical protein D4S01_11415, partial [Dehalococcoidia bacterium]